MNKRARSGVLLVGLLLATGCESVHYRTHDFGWTSTGSLPDVGVEIVTTGTSTIQDSAGVLIERNANPYRVGIYFTRQSATPVELLRVTFVAEQTRRVITLPMEPTEDLGDGSLTLISVAPAVQLPFENYRVDLHVRIGAGTEAREVHITGTLKTRFEQSKALRFWEEMMSV
jgi:hypothetical protein